MWAFRFHYLSLVMLLACGKSGGEGHAAAGASASGAAGEHAGGEHAAAHGHEGHVTVVHSAASAGHADEHATANAAASEEPPPPAPPQPSVVFPSAFEKGGCGKRGQPKCPMQNFMATEVQPALVAADGARLALVLSAVAKSAPPGFADWARFAMEGAQAAEKKKDVASMKVACKNCHLAYRKKYVTTLRERVFRADLPAWSSPAASGLLPTDLGVEPTPSASTSAVALPSASTSASAVASASAPAAHGDKPAAHGDEHKH